MLREIETRKSTRKYKVKDVSTEQINELLESARLAPSGSNTQPWHFIVVRDLAMRRRITEADHNQQWMMSAPVFIVCVGDSGCRIPGNEALSVNEESPRHEVKQVIRDVAIAVEHMVIQAENMGLSTCWTAWFTQAEMRPVLGIPEDKYVVCVLTVGYGDEERPPMPKRKLEDMVRYEKW